MITLRKQQVAEKLRVSKQCIAKWIREGKFVKPFYLGTLIPVWDEADVDQWLEDQKKQQGDPDGNPSNGTAESLCIT